MLTKVRTSCWKASSIVLGSACPPILISGHSTRSLVATPFGSTKRVAGAYSSNRIRITATNCAGFDRVIRYLTPGLGRSIRARRTTIFSRTAPESNTFSKEQADSLIAKYGGVIAAVKVVKMRLLGINRVIEEHFPKKPPDLLSIDTEGLDLAILQKLDFDRFRPPVVCAEMESDVSTAEAEILQLMRSKGYSVRAIAINNAIFVDDHRWH